MRISNPRRHRANGTIYVGSDDGYLSAFGQSPSLAVTKSVLPASTAPGGAVTYTLQVQNTGEGGASHVILTDTLRPESAMCPTAPNTRRMMRRAER